MSDMITVTGNIATEPERRQTPTGVPVTTFRVASSQRHFDRARSEWVESGTNWYSVSSFRSLAEHAFDSLHKGERVILTGRLRLREWETAAKRGISVEIDAEAIGHDLRWGTTRYERAARAEGTSGAGATPPTDAPSAAAPASHGTSAGETGDAWATAPGDWGAPSAAPHPVPAPPSSELVPSDTPF